MSKRHRRLILQSNRVWQSRDRTLEMNGSKWKRVHCSPVVGSIEHPYRTYLPFQWDHEKPPGSTYYAYRPYVGFLNV